MTDKELRKLSRRELLEMLLEQSKEVTMLREQLKGARTQLQNRKIQLEEAGNIAEAALQLNGVFQAAQQAADQYLESIAQLKLRQETICQEMERAKEEAQAEAKAEAERQLAETQERCRAMEQEIEDKYNMMIEKFKIDAQAYWETHKV